jgi:murein DD-endopeptidase MepM/ murein hydrolase activator NlpD
MSNQALSQSSPATTNNLTPDLMALKSGKRIILAAVMAAFISSSNLVCGAADVHSTLHHSASTVVAYENTGSSEAKKRLLQQEKLKLEKEKREYHNKAQAIRKNERKAYEKLGVIQRELNATTGKLTDTKKQVNHTETKLNETQAKLTTVKTKEAGLKDSAASRLREIYEGNRLSFVEMLFQVDNLQTLLDRLYYQERVAEQDRKLIDELRLRESVLSQNKEQLGQKKNKLAEMVSQIAEKAIAIAKEKLDQQQTAERLRSQRAFYEQAERELANESARLEKQIFVMENSNRKKGGPITVGSGNMCMPLRAPVTSPFGWRKHPIFGVRKFHSGVDLAGPNRSAIHAADGGNVLYTGWYGGYGKVVIISHGNSMATLYAHLSRVAVSSGDNVSKGDVIAYEGTTGFSTGPHLHFEVRVNGKPNNPMSYVR